MDEELKKTKVATFIKANWLNGLVIIISIAYVMWGMVKIETTDLTVVEVLASAGIGLIIGFVIKQALGEEGFVKGYNSMLWKNQLDKYSNACNMANKYIERVDLFYEEEEKEKKFRYRQSNLMAVRLKYNDFFDSQGNYTQPTIITLKKAENPPKMQDRQPDTQYLTRQQKRVLDKCVKVKIYNLNLFSEYSNEIANETHRERTDKDQRHKMLSANSIALLSNAIVGAYFTAMWNSWNWGSFIGATTQLAIWIGIGITQLYTNYNYVVLDKTAKLTRKIELIVKFVRGCENGKYEIDKKEGNNDGTKEEVFNTTDTICDK